MEAAGPLYILLQHLQSDPGSVTERSAKDLILKSLRLLGHGVASINKQRRQEIVKSCNITDVTQPAKHFVPIQTYLFGESKASELNFVGDLRQSNLRRIQAKPQSSLQKSQSNIHLKGPQTLPGPRTHHSFITSLFARLLSGKNGTRQEIIQTSKSSTSLQQAESSS